MTASDAKLPSPGAQPGAKPAAAKRPREPRLDFFRGIAMFIILLAHTPGNTWTLWIPARFGFSDATEIFVFCSGMASAMAFGAVFANKGFFIGGARIAFRVWQVYWAHIGVFLVTAIMLFSIDYYDIGNRDNPYIEGPWVVPLFEQTGEALIGLFTLTYVPGLFDILPMYLVILAMIPVVMAIHRLGGTPAVLAAMAIVWLAANLAGYARIMAREDEVAAWQAAIVALGEPLSFLNFPSYPWGDGTWFFNPFGWQIVFFAGFAFGMGWLPAPPINRTLIFLALAVLLLTVPLAWHKIHGGYSVIADTWVHGWVAAARDFIEPLRWKTWQGGLRFLHFLAVAYLALALVGPRGVYLSEGFPHAAPGRLWIAGALAVLVATLPIAYPHEIGLLVPGYAAAIEAVFTFNQQGMLQLLHLAALIVAAWAMLGEGGRAWVARDLVLKVVPVIRKVGTQSLAVFMVSIPLSRFNGWVLDLIGRDVWTKAAVNASGFAILIAVAYLVSWLKRQPWRDAPSPNARGAGGTVGLAARAGGAVPAQRG
ncbi:MAG: OpgC family protein [Pikeienuella sp.]